MNSGYKVLTLSDLVKQLGLPSSKGYKTKDYLELVMESIEEKGLRFVQFLQLVDVLYVFVQKLPNSSSGLNTPEKRKSNSAPEKNTKARKTQSKPAEELIEETILERTDLSKDLAKPKLPWQK